MTNVICDTNIWYNIANHRFVPPSNIELVATQFSMYELATSEQIASNPKLVQKTIKAIHDWHGSIIPLHPLDFVLSNQKSRFLKPDTKIVENILKSFEDMLNINFDDIKTIPKDLLSTVREESKKSRQGLNEFCDYTNSLLPAIRKNINKSTGKKGHLLISTESITKDFFLGFLNKHLETKGDKIEDSDLDWDQIELFLCVTENFFKKLETTKEMKFHPNDVTDWLNMLYVQPGDQYLTFDESWKDYILNDSRIRHYCFVP